MKIIGRVFRENDAHVAAQISVDCIPKFPRRDRALKLHICDLTFCVHPGIGAPRSMNNDFSIIEQRQHARQFALYGAQLTLHLPAVKVRTVVLKQKAKVH